MNGRCPFKPSREENKMGDFYVKSSNGKFVPVSFQQVITKDWENKAVVVEVGTDDRPASQEEIDETLEAIKGAVAFDPLDGTSFFVTAYGVRFEVLGSLKEIGEKYVAVRVTGGDDLNQLGDLQKEARKQLRGRTKKVIVLPTPLTVKDYKEVMEIKRRCDTRRSRRGS
jgi:hypothetical protein